MAREKSNTPINRVKLLWVARLVAPFIMIFRLLVNTLGSLHIQPRVQRRGHETASGKRLGIGSIVTEERRSGGQGFLLFSPIRGGPAEPAQQLLCGKGIAAAEQSLTLDSDAGGPAVFIQSQYAR